MTPIIESADVNRSAPDVYAYVTDPTRFSEWQQGVVTGRMETDNHAGPHRCITVRRVGFSEQQTTSELVHADPPKTWSVCGVDGPIRARVDVTVVPTGDTTSRVTISLDFDGHGIGRLLVPLVVQRQARREMPVNLLNLKSRLEAAATTPQGYE
jgi:hypothetical protein